MSRYLGPRLKVERRYGKELELVSSERSSKDKCHFDTRPGMHGAARRKTPSVYGSQLAEKNSLRYSRGLSEKQFKLLYKEAARQQGSTGINLLQLLESRLDNLVFRMGFASTRAEARQLVSHKCIMLEEPVGQVATDDVSDGEGGESGSGTGGSIAFRESRIVNIPSVIVKPGSKIHVKERSKKQDRVKRAMSLYLEKANTPEWVDVDSKDFSGVYKYKPEQDQLPTDINVQMIVELYSK
jgi:small subunit ribosomal protein S4